MLDVLDIEQLEVNLFRGRSPQDRWQRVFGGQVIGQALVAACRTVEGRPPHSLHAYFLIGGDPKVPIIYEVDRIRDGRSFTTRRVVAIQHGQAIFTLMVSFHNDEEGLTHQAAMPEVPPPEDLPSEAQIRATVLPSMPEAVQRYYKSERPIELRPVEYGRYLGKKTESGKFNVWIKRNRQIARRSGDPPMRARLCVRHVAARYRAGAAWTQPVREGIHGREPRPRALAAPSVPRRRLAPVRAGKPEHDRLARLRARADLPARRRAGGERRAGGAGADQAEGGLASMPASTPWKPAGRALLRRAGFCLVVLAAATLASPAQSQCAISTTNVAFGNVDLISGGTITTTGTITVNCPGGFGNFPYLWFCVSIGVGTNSTSVNNRTMKSGANTLGYRSTPTAG